PPVPVEPAPPPPAVPVVPAPPPPVVPATPVPAVPVVPPRPPAPAAPVVPAVPVAAGRLQVIGMMLVSESPQTVSVMAIDSCVEPAAVQVNVVFAEVVLPMVPMPVGFAVKL